MVVVVDASAVVEMLIRGPQATTVESTLDQRESFAPTLLDVEVLKTIARFERADLLAPRAADAAVAALGALPVVRIPSDSLTRGAWGLRSNLSIADAFYVALAHRLQAMLLTADARLARAPGLSVPVTLLPS